MDELLLIDNWTTQTLYAPPTNMSGSLPLPTDSQGNTLPLAGIFTVDSGAPNTRADGSQRINVTQPIGDAGPLLQSGLSPQLVQQIAMQPFRSFSTLLQQRGVDSQAIQILLNAATFTQGSRVAGKINLNTASAAVLETVPGVTTSIASAIVRQQWTGFRAGRFGDGARDNRFADPRSPTISLWAAIRGLFGLGAATMTVWAMPWRPWCGFRAARRRLSTGTG